MNKNRDSKEFIDKVVRLKDIVAKLKDVAMIDGKISNDERSIILNIGHNVEKYISVIKENVNVEDADLHVIQKKILQDAQAKAFEDGKLTSEEKSLLLELVNIMEIVTE